MRSLIHRLVREEQGCGLQERLRNRSSKPCHRLYHGGQSQSRTLRPVVGVTQPLSGGMVVLSFYHLGKDQAARTAQKTIRQDASQAVRTAVKF
jgi:hypothetical protein